MRLNRLLVASPQHLKAFGLAVCLLAQDGLALESRQGPGEGPISELSDLAETRMGLPSFARCLGK